MAHGEMLDDSAKGNCTLLPSLGHGIRAGWAEASQAIAEAGDDVLIWPEFGNMDDHLLQW